MSWGGRRQQWAKEVSASVCGWRRNHLWDLLTSPWAMAWPRRCVFALAGTARPRAGVIQVEHHGTMRRWHKPPSPSSHGAGKDSSETQALMNRNGLGRVQLPGSGSALPTWHRLAMCGGLRSWGGPGEQTWDPLCATYIPRHWVLQVQGTSRGDRFLLEQVCACSRVPRSLQAAPRRHLAIITANPLEFVPHSWFYLTGLSQAPPASLSGSSLLPSPTPETQKPLQRIPRGSSLASMSGLGWAFPAKPGAVAAATQQHGPGMPSTTCLLCQVKAPLPSSLFPSWGQSFFGNLYFCFFLSPHTQGEAQAGSQQPPDAQNRQKTPAKPAAGEGLGRPQALGTNTAGKSTQRCFSHGVPVQCSPAAGNARQPEGTAWRESIFLPPSRAGQSSPWGAMLCGPREMLSPKDSWRRVLVMANRWWRRSGHGWHLWR